jgi:tetratricopeptide (TPR) repeat protein
MQKLGGPGGDLGADRYQAAMAGLKRDAPAYAKHQQALAAAQKGDLAAARKLANEAVKLQPREARFHGLLGDLEMAEKDPRGALPYYQKAGELDPGYFKPMAQAGIAHYQLGNRAAAEPLLAKSMQLLPTAPGAYYLGRLNEDRGSKAEAVQYYKMVAGTKSAIGEEALTRLVQLDLAEHPDSYLSIQPQLDNQGRVWLTVGNRTKVPVRDVSVVVGVVDASGRTAYGPERVTSGGNVIPGGQAVNLRTALGPFNTAEVLRYVKWKVEGARPAQ